MATKKRFQHHPDGQVIVENGPVLYIEVEAQFVADAKALGLPGYASIRDDRDGELYVRGDVRGEDGEVKVDVVKFHASFGDDTQHAGTLEQDDMDAWIAAAEQLAGLQAARRVEAQREHLRRQNEQHLASMEDAVATAKLKPLDPVVAELIKSG